MDKFNDHWHFYVPKVIILDAVEVLKILNTMKLKISKDEVQNFLFTIFIADIFKLLVDPATVVHDSRCQKDERRAYQFIVVFKDFEIDNRM